MRKFLFSGAVLGAGFSAIGLVRTTAKGPRDWRLALMWLSWAAGAAIALGTVIEKDRELQS